MKLYQGLFTLVREPTIVRAMEKKPTKPRKTLRLRKESLKTLNNDQLIRVNAGAIATDPWDPPPQQTAYPICQVA